MPCKVQIRIQKHFDRLLKYGILWPFQSSWNTPLLPVQKPGAEDFRPVQDQWAVNSATVTLYFIIPNPYMLLGLVPAEAKFFTCLDLPPLEPFHKPTCLDLKDAFFCICLAPQSQPIFAFQWENPNTGEKRQLTWTWLPQGFKKSPTIFGTSLASNLKALADQHSCTCLYYIDDLLLAGPTREDCMEGTHLLLFLLWEAGCKVFRKKVQICQNSVKYLSFHLSQDQCRLVPERKQAVCSIPAPKTFWQIRVFGSCRFMLNLDL
jgi:hypothetical protein